MTAHAEFGFSKMARIVKCPGSYLLGKHIPPSPSSEFADRGTLLHNAMEKLVDNDEGPWSAVVESVLGMTYKGHTIDDEMITEKIIPAMNAVIALFDQYHVDQWECESKVVLQDDIWGTCDLLAYGHDDDSPVTLSLDYKFGDGIIVSAQENIQLLGYASAGYCTPSTEDLFHPEGRVICGIIQPSNHREDDYELWEVPGKADLAMNDAADKFEVAVATAKHPDGELNTGAHCKWCPAGDNGLCPKLNGDAHRALQLPPNDLAKLQQALELVEQLKPWIKAVEAAAFHQLEIGADLPGWKTVLKHGRRAWVDEAEALAKLARRLGGKGKVTDSKLKSPAQIEKLAKAQGKELDLGDLVATVSSGTTMVPESDKRPAVLSMKQVDEALKSIAG